MLLQALLLNNMEMKNMNRIERIIPTVWINNQPEFDELVNVFLERGVKKIRVNCTRHSIAEYKKVISDFQKGKGDLFELIIDIPIPKKKVRIFYDWQGSEMKILKNKTYRITKSSNERKHQQDIYVEDNEYSALENIPKGRILTIGENCAAVRVENKAKEAINVKGVCEGNIPYGKYITAPEMRYAECSEEVAKGYISLVNSISCYAVALSFVESAKEVNKVRDMLGGNTRIISKIETMNGVNNINEIIKASDEVMIARGDLLINVGYNFFAKSCHDIAITCEKYKKKYYFATGIFESYSSEGKRPSRSELCELYSMLKYTNSDVILEYNKCRLPKQAVEVLDIIREVVV